MAINFAAAQQAFNEILKDVEYSPTHICDFILDVDELYKSKCIFLRTKAYLKWFIYNN